MLKLIINDKICRVVFEFRLTNYSYELNLKYRLHLLSSLTISD